MSSKTRTGSAAQPPRPARVRVRAARVGDLASILKVERDAFGSDAYAPVVLRQLMDICGRGMRVATVGSTVAGYAVGSVCTGTPDGWLLCVAVATRFRRRGIGRLLSATVVEYLRTQRVARVFLTVHPDKHGSIAMYRGLGFRVVRRSESYFGARAPRLVMAHAGDAPAQARRRCT